jgi:hypothetical protein
MLAFAAQVITSYKANVDSHVRELQKLKGAERERAEATIEGNKKVSESLENLRKGVEEFGHVFEKAFEFGKEAFAAYAEHTKLATATAHVKHRQPDQGVGRSEDADRADARRRRAADERVPSSTPTRWPSSRRRCSATRGKVSTLRRCTRRCSRRSPRSRPRASTISACTSTRRASRWTTRRIAPSCSAASWRSSRTRQRGWRRGSRPRPSARPPPGVAFVDATDRMKEAVGKLAVSLTPLIEKAAKMLGLVGDLSDPNKGGPRSLHAAQEG